MLAALALAAALAAPPKTQIAAAWFGVFRPKVTGEMALGVTSDVYLADMDDFGWVIELKEPAPRIVHWRETLTLPAAPETWGDSEAQGRHVAADGRSAVTEQDQTVDGGAVWHVWRLAPGDPKGRYLLTVQLDGAPEQRFEFTVR